MKTTTKIKIDNTKCIYSIEEIIPLVNSPFLDTRPKMFKFLRKYNFLTDMMPQPELIARGFFTLVFYPFKNGNFRTTVQKVLVSRKGIEFITKFAKLIHG